MGDFGEPLFNFAAIEPWQQLKLSRPSAGFGPDIDHTGIYFPIDQINLLVGVPFGSMPDCFADYYGAHRELQAFQDQRDELNRLQLAEHRAAQARAEERQAAETERYTKMLTSLLTD